MKRAAFFEQQVGEHPLNVLVENNSQNDGRGHKYARNFGVGVLSLQAPYDARGVLAQLRQLFVGKDHTQEPIEV